jgi:hypothetical protein
MEVQAHFMALGNILALAINSPSSKWGDGIYG